MMLIVESPLTAQAPFTNDPQLLQGIRQVEEGDLDGAVFSLDSTVRRLSTQKGRENDLAVAHLYLAMAHLGLSRMEAAKAEAMAAWRTNKNMTLDPKKFPPTLLKMYDEARLAAAPPPPQKKGGSSRPVLLGLGLVAVGGGVAVAAKGAGGSGTGAEARPSVTIQASGQGAITGVTVLTFNASATRLTSPTFSWNFGDGGTSTGASVQHRFDVEGTFSVAVTANGPEGTAAANTSVSSRTITGKWSDAAACPPPPSPTTWCMVVELVQQGTALGGTYQQYAGANTGDDLDAGTVRGSLTAPNQVVFTQSPRTGPNCYRTYTMTLASDLNNMTGRVTSPIVSCTPFTTAFRRQ